MSKKDKKKLKNLPTYNKKTLVKYILHIFHKNPTEPYNYKQIANKLDIKDDQTKNLITSALYELVDEGKVEEVYTGKFKFVQRDNYITGTVDMTAKGDAYIVPDDMEEHVYVSQGNLNHALNADKVKVFLFAKRKKQKQLEGEVVEILNRSITTFVGTVDISKNYAFLVTEQKKMPYDIFIPIDKLKKAKQGEKAVAKIVEWPKHAKNPIGEIIEVLGRPGDNDVEINSIMAEFNLPVHFSKKVEEEANLIPVEITKEEIAKRRDFRNILTFTIDPVDAKDFDDALSIQKLPNGNWEVGVHIADVTHYVEKDSLLDKEAMERGTSVYLVDRVVPMLPEKLSNFVCSLRPDEEKLTFSVVYELDSNANIINHWIGKTIILSRRRYNYDEVLNIIETGAGDYSSELQVLDDLAQKLRALRFRKGAIAFDRTEVKFKIDDKGKPLGVYFKSSTKSTQLIEEFMLLANKSVAEFVGMPKDSKKVKVFVYRVHDEPDIEKLANFSKFIKRFGYTFEFGSNKTIANSMNSLLDNVNGKNEQGVIENLAIRSMAKAEYSTKNIGHYGLAFDYYSHFTSPIRRYPDMMAHRLLYRYLNNESSVSKEKYEKICKHASDMEQRATLAERASVKYKQVEFMQDKLGFIFEGVVSGVTEWGLFVEIVENRIEGMISIRDLGSDYYVFDDKNYCITGKRTGRKFQLGDKLKIQVVKANLERKQLDFVLAD